jgi:DNA invertase Pin-like site-specific DNA recombinase
LKQAARRHGWTVATVFTDDGLSGARGRDKRPGFDALLNGVARREFDLVAAWSVCRLGRSLQDLVGFLEELKAKDMDLYLHQQGVDTSTPAGRALFQMLGVFAEFERAMIQDWVRAGLARARARGRRLGRPRVSGKVEQAVRAKRAEGKRMIKIARELGLGVGTVKRIVDAAEAAQSA